jgi:hypothetical protein
VNRQVQLPLLDEESALNHIIEHVRQSETRKRADSYNRQNYGYDLFVPDAVSDYLRAYDDQRRPANYSGGTITYDLKTNSAPFYDAAWSLCQKGVLRPSTISYGPSAQYNARVESGFSLTSYGKSWLERTSGYEYIPLEFGHFSRILADHAPTLGINYQSRSQEALRCYRAQTYLACCTMCGAAAEAIILTIAIAKSNDEARIQKDYLSSGGRGRIETLILGQQKSAIQSEFRGSTGLLKYWRDNASHGLHTTIQESEAFLSLTLLLRFAQFATDRFSELTS